jgi:hypothetical protein
MVRVYIKALMAKTVTRQHITTAAIEVVSQNEPIRTQKSGASLDEAPIRLRLFSDDQPYLFLRESYPPRPRANAIVPKYNSAPLLKHRTLRAAWRKSLRGSTDIE